MSECQKDLSNIETEIKRFFREFGKQHDIAHKDYLGIKKICDTLNAALAIFSAADYGCGQSPQETECQIAEFVSSFYELRLEAIQYITHLRYYVAVLLNTADNFTCGRHLVCKNDPSCSGCEEETNELNCDLLEFFTSLKQAGETTKQLLDDLLQSCDILGELVREFDCTINPKCHRSECGCKNSAGQGNVNILDSFKTFISEFVPPHDAAHETLLTIGGICDLLTAAIEAWEERV